MTINPNPMPQQMPLANFSRRASIVVKYVSTTGG